MPQQLVPSAPAAPVSHRVLPTGHPEFDQALGVGGLSRGRLVELQSSSPLATTALALRAAAETQARGGVVAYIDGAQSFDLQLMNAMGVDPSHLLVSQPDHALMALEISLHLSRSGAVDLVIVDSLGALMDAGSSTPPLAISEALRRLCGSAEQSRTCFLFTTQPRSGLSAGISNSLRYLSSVRCQVARVGRHGLIRVVKNKLAPTFTEATVDLQLS